MTIRNIINDCVYERKENGIFGCVTVCKLYFSHIVDPQIHCVRFAFFFFFGFFPSIWDQNGGWIVIYFLYKWIWLNIILWFVDICSCYMSLTVAWIPFYNSHVIHKECPSCAHLSLFSMYIYHIHPYTHTQELTTLF